MVNKKPQFYYLLALLSGTLLIVFFIFRPFIYTLISAIVFTVVFQPVHKKVLWHTRQRRWIAALITSIIIITIVLVPVVLLGMQIFKEAQQLYSEVTAVGGKNNILNAIKEITINIQRYIPVPVEFSPDFHKYLEQGLDWLLKNIGGVFSNITKMILNFFIFLIALYYLLKDGQRLKKTVVDLSPLPDADDEKILNKLALAVNSVIKGNLTVAAVQGVLTAIGFAIFGVPNAVLWGTVTAIAALIPGFGTSLVLIPAILFLFFNSGIFNAAGLLVWGAVAVGLIDNFLGPKLVGRGIQLHPLIVLLSVLGGLGLFGPVGILLGPLAISMLFALFEIYLSLKTQELAELDHFQKNGDS